MTKVITVKGELVIEGVRQEMTFQFTLTPPLGQEGAPTATQIRGAMMHLVNNNIQWSWKEETA